MRTVVSQEYRILERAPHGSWALIAVAYYREFAVAIAQLAASDSPETHKFEAHSFIEWSDGERTGECVWTGSGSVK